MKNQHTNLRNSTTVTISEGSVVSKPTQPAREGYNFLGWYVGSSLYDFNSPVYTD
ncbi:MAG TPA: InlB B-repeat-containing protein, partial [Acholeplasma sp.]|nr:InlB B-repeat-containing protein [Acholeplasma sp.]